MEERAENTFIGDLDELMGGLKENYPEATIVFSTPLPNVLHDVLRKERDYMLPQVVIVNAIKKLAQEHEIPVIDLYNSNILDTHDAAVIYNYMPDGVHCNPAGYSLLAEHFAAELIKLYEDEAAIENDDGDMADGEMQKEDEDSEEKSENKLKDKLHDLEAMEESSAGMDENREENVGENTEEDISKNTNENSVKIGEEGSEDYKNDPQPYKN